MPNWCFNTILISGPRKDVSVLYKSLIEYKDEIRSKGKEPGKYPFNIGAWIKDKFSDKLPEFTEDDYELSYTNFILKHTYKIDAALIEAHIVLYTESKWDSRMYALVKLIEVGFPKCILHYVSEGPGKDYYINTDESGKYFPERWYYNNRFKSDYCISNEDMYRTLINDYEDIIKVNNIVIPTLIDDPEVSQIHELVESLVEYDRELYVYPFSIEPEYDDKKVGNIESAGV